MEKKLPRFLELVCSINPLNMDVLASNIGGVNSCKMQLLHNLSLHQSVAENILITMQIILNYLNAEY